MPNPSDDETDRVRDAERLRELEQRLSGKGGDRPVSRTEEHFSQANMAWRMVTELVAGLVLGFGIGYGLDQLFGTTPILLVIFTLLGLWAGVKTLMRTAAEIGKKPGNSGSDKGE